MHNQNEMQQHERSRHVFCTHTYLIQMQKVFFYSGPRIGSEGRAGCGREQGWLCMRTGLGDGGRAGCTWGQG